MAPLPLSSRVFVSITAFEEIYIVAITTLQLVITPSAKEVVITRTAFDHIIARTTDENIIT